MKPTLKQLNEIFEELNEKFFNNELPTIPFVLKDMKPLGQYQRKRNSFTWKVESRCIRISTRYDFTESQLRNTMCHEMVHLWEFETKKSCGHGYWFKWKAKEIAKIDSTMLIERVYNSSNEGKLEYAYETQATILCWKEGDKYCIGRVHPNYESDIVRWLSKKHNDLFSFVCSDKEFTKMPQCRSRITFWRINEAQLNAYLAKSIKRVNYGNVA